VEPDPILRDALIEVAIEVDESRSEDLTYEYQWYINHVAVHGATTPVFDPTSLRRGDVVHVEIIGSNDKGERSSYRPPAVTVRNAPPIVQNVVLEQDLPHRRLLAKVQASDADHDDIHFVFRWLRNDKVVSEGPKEVFEAAALAENDVFTVEVIPHDSEGAGEPVRANPLVAGNNAPNIVSQPLVMGNPESYEYAAEAKDPEGDAVVFELETGPTGMVIDKRSGHVVWKVPPSLKGTHHVKIVAADAKGARSWQEFDLSIPTAPSKAESPSAS
jgi:Putative Ig domain